jgi:hypothetical protein
VMKPAQGRPRAQITKMLGCADQGFVAISAMALKAAISGSILAAPEACLAMMMALPFGSTRAFATAKSLFPRGHLSNVMDERQERVAG